MPQLTPRDLRDVSTALEVVLRPDEARDSDDHRRTVVETVKSLTGADRGCYIVYVGAELSSVGDYPPVRLIDYGIRLEDVAPSVDIWARHEAQGVTRRDDLWLPICPEFYETPYYRDYVTPLRAFDGMGVNWRRGPGRGVANMVQLLVHHDSGSGPRFGDREHAILQLLRPALMSALKHARLDGLEVTQVFESFPEPAFVVAPDGVLLEANRAARTLFAEDTGAERVIREALGAVLKPGSGSLSIGTAELQPAMIPVPVGGRMERLRLTRLALGGDRGTGYLVTLSGRSGGRADLESVARARGLTPRQAEVAALLCARLRSREIAERLDISPTTVRRHEERVFQQLAVHRRIDVEAALLGEELPSTGD